MTFSAASFMIPIPAAVLPVKEMCRKSGREVMPSRGARSAGRKLTSPFGIPAASIASAMRKLFIGLSNAILTTTGQRRAVRRELDQGDREGRVPRDDPEHRPHRLVHDERLDVPDPAALDTRGSC